MYLKPTVETIAEFGKIPRQMPLSASMMGAVHRIFHVANNSVEPLEHLVVIIFSSDRGDKRLLQALLKSESAFGPQYCSYLAVRRVVLRSWSALNPTAKSAKRYKI